MQNLQQMAERTTILRVVVGSTLHGLNVQDGMEDRDEMGVCVEDIQHVVGLSQFEQVVYRTAAEREQKHNARNSAGDLDLVIYSLRKYLRLALGGNPTILNLLFAPRDKIVVSNALGFGLMELAPDIISKKAGRAFLGYCQAQRQRLLGERGQRDINRPELVEKYGFDTKYAMHMLRLGFQGVELLKTGRVSCPMQEPERSWLLGVRTGKATLQECLTKAGELDQELKDLLETSPLPDEPNTEKVESWMVNVYLQQWKARDLRYKLENGRLVPEGATT